MEEPKSNRSAHSHSTFFQHHRRKMNSNKRRKSKRRASLRNLQILLLLAVFVIFCNLVLMHKVLHESESLSFPPDCTWQCYIRQNEDLLQKLPWNEAVAIQHYQTHGVHDNRNCACKVLILAGPHKAVSTSLQNMATIFSNTDNIQWHWLFKQKKGFAPFVKRFYGEEEEVNPEPTFDTLRELARNEIQTKYDQGYNIILGSEEIDYVTTDEPSKNNTIIDEIINILPKKVREYRHKHLSSLVVYRAPRSSHLKSLWVQIQSLKRKAFGPRLSFKQYICRANNRRGLERNFYKVDALALTKILLQKGIAVKLFDMMSLDESNTNGRSLSSMLGCDVMGLSCTTDEVTNQIIPVAVDQHRMKIKRLLLPKNIGSEKKLFNSTDQLKMFDISNEQFLQIEESLKKYDCAQYAEMIKYDDKLELLLYNDKSMLNDNMRKCKNYSDFLTSHYEVLQSMKAIVGCDKDVEQAPGGTV